MNLTKGRPANSYWPPELAHEANIPVAKPLLPTAEEIAPYLRRIDGSRWYSNGGPLVQEFEARLAQHAGLAPGSVATVSNATIGLTLALLAHDLPAGSLCMVPAWTFAATAHAVQLAGLVPWIVDVSHKSWALETEAARELLRMAPGHVSAVVPVSPFGRPLDTAAWESFSRETDVAVVLDAAATFDRVPTAQVPAVVSLHATKVLGIGEGGFVICRNQAFVAEIQKRSNFGFWNSREAQTRSINGKISEYSAAVGLAALDSWPAIRADFARVAATYSRLLRDLPNLTILPEPGADWVSSTIMASAPEVGAERLTTLLAASRIESRRWWGGGLHRHAAFAKMPRASTVDSDALANSVIGLPCYRDLPNETISRVCNVLRAACG